MDSTPTVWEYIFGQYRSFHGSNTESKASAGPMIVKIVSINMTFLIC